jgi:hypothetical protein
MKAEKGNGKCYLRESNHKSEEEEMAVTTSRVETHATASD